MLEETWVVDDGYCVWLDAANHTAARFSSPTLNGQLGYGCVTPWSMYVASLYFSVMTITSIGYGDISATPLNVSEQLICTVLMLFGAVVWGYVVGNFCAYLATMSPSKLEYRLSMSALNEYVHTNRLPHQMRLRLRDYFQRTKHLRTSHSAGDFLLKLSPLLQREVVLHVNRTWITKVR